MENGAAATVTVSPRLAFTPAAAETRLWMVLVGMLAALVALTATAIDCEVRVPGVIVWVVLVSLIALFFTPWSDV